MIYLDNAATSFPKPRAVCEEVVRCMTSYGGNPGRGAHALSLVAAEKIYECRALAAELFGVDDPARVFFTLNTTHGLNTVIKGLLRSGDHVLISDLEHNAVYRPLWKMAEENKITFGVFDSMATSPERSAESICGGIYRKLKPSTRMIVTTHASNICSLKMPIREIGALCRENRLFFVVDGAQSAGHEAIAVDDMGIDALCVPGHKGLYGPQGCGLVILGKNVLPSTLMEGGNGVHSLEGGMPDFSPERFEAGTLPTPAIAGLCEGIKAVRNLGVARIAGYERALFQKSVEILKTVPNVKLYLPEAEGSVLLLNVEGYSAEEVGRFLNERQICVRSGYHCTALGHRRLQTPRGGAVRASFGIYNTLVDVEAFCGAIEELAKGKAN